MSYRFKIANRIESSEMMSIPFDFKDSKAEVWNKTSRVNEVMRVASEIDLMSAFRHSFGGPNIS